MQLRSGRVKVQPSGESHHRRDCGRRKEVAVEITEARASRGQSRERKSALSAVAIGAVNCRGAVGGGAGVTDRQSIVVACRKPAVRCRRVREAARFTRCEGRRAFGGLCRGFALPGCSERYRLRGANFRRGGARLTMRIRSSFRGAVALRDCLRLTTGIRTGVARASISAGVRDVALTIRFAYCSRSSMRTCRRECQNHRGQQPHSYLLCFHRFRPASVRTPISNCSTIVGAAQCQTSV
jgi:hypothetical protein